MAQDQEVIIPFTLADRLMLQAVVSAVDRIEQSADATSKRTIRIEEKTDDNRKRAEALDRRLKVIERWYPVICLCSMGIGAAGKQLVETTISKFIH